MIEIATNVHAQQPKGAPFFVETCPFNFGEEFDTSQLHLRPDKINSWPMVYILSNDDDAYVGETTSIKTRMAQHLENEERRDFTQATIICNDEFNMSTTKYYEHRLIDLFNADGLFTLTNKNKGKERSDYFSFDEYNDMFNSLWEELRQERTGQKVNHIKLANQSIKDIEESEVFKYSPFKELTNDQYVAVEKILAAIDEMADQGLDSAKPILVEGSAGTGKTIVAIHLLKALRDSDKYKDLEVRIVEPVAALCGSLQKSLDTVHNLSANDVLSPNDLVKPEVYPEKYQSRPADEKHFDILLVDETFRLRQGKALQNLRGFYDNNLKLGFPEKGGTQLDWVLQQAKLPVLFYDPLQVGHPSSIGVNGLQNAVGVDAYSKPIHLESQMRVKGGDDYLSYICSILSDEHPEPRGFKSYDFVFHDRIESFYDSFERTHEEHELTRMVAGYAWKWKSKGDNNAYDIEFDSVKLRWNDDYNRWIPRGTTDPARAQEVGCIHSVQGYDLSYAYVIFGDDIRIDHETGKLVANKSGYMDNKGKSGVADDPETLTEYIKNIYYVLLTRGIYGTHVFVANPELREYLAQYFLEKE